MIKVAAACWISGRIFCHLSDLRGMKQAHDLKDQKPYIGMKRQLYSEDFQQPFIFHALLTFFAPFLVCSCFIFLPKSDLGWFLNARFGAIILVLSSNRSLILVSGLGSRL